MSIDFKPDFERYRTAILCQGEPDRVPFGDLSIYEGHKARILGHVPHTLEDEVEFAQRMGYDVVPFFTGLHETPVLRAAMEGRLYEVAAASAFKASGETVERHWAAGGTGAMTTDAAFEAFPWPSPDDFDLSFLDAADRRLPRSMRVIAVIGKIFNPVWWLMGFEAFSHALFDNPAFVERLFEKVGSIQYGILERCLEHPSVGVHWCADDVAFNTTLMVSPATLRKYVFPWFRRMNKLAHDRGALTIYHTDGRVDSILEDIIDLDFDALDPIDPSGMDIVKTHERVAGRLCLIGNIDLRYTLTLGTPAEVEAEVRDRIRDLAPGGGYMLASANSVPDYVPFENYVAMRDAWFKYGKYPISI
jgi:uroporphyrinogen decarboxylase